MLQTWTWTWAWQFYLLNHLATQISSLEGNLSGRKALSILDLMKFLFVVFFQMFFVILSLQEEHTCMHLWRLIIIIIISLNARSGKLSQFGWSPISAMLVFLACPKCYSPLFPPVPSAPFDPCCCLQSLRSWCSWHCWSTWFWSTFDRNEHL